MCGTPDPDDPLAGNANAKTTLPTDFPFLKDNGYKLPDESDNTEDIKTKTSETTKPTEGATSCWAKKLGYNCCTGCNAIYSDDDGKYVNNCIYSN